MRTAAYGEYRFGVGRYGEVIDGQKKILHTVLLLLSKL